MLTVCCLIQYSGGKSGALVVQTDQEWSRVQNMLRGSPRVTAVTFHFNITESLLTPYLQSSAPLGQAPFTNTAPVFATQVSLAIDIPVTVIENTLNRCPQ